TQQLELPTEIARSAMALALSIPTPLFTDNQLQAASLVAGEHPGEVRATLVDRGWVRSLTAEVSAFTTLAHHDFLRESATRLLGADAAASIPQRVAATLPRARHDAPLTSLIQLAAHAARHPQSDGAWDYAKFLASWGDLRRAV